MAFEAGLIGKNDSRQVHHRNHDKLDNRLENLEVKTPRDHGLLHGDEIRADHQRAGELYESGMTLEQVAAEIGVHWASVPRLLKRAGVSSRSPGRKRTIDRERVRGFAAQGMAQREIARRVGCSHKAVANILRERGE